MSPAPPRDEAHGAELELLLARRGAMQGRSVTDLSLLRPVQAVPGGPSSALPQASAAERRISSAALEAASAYSAARGGIGFGVWCGDRLEIEAYAQSFGPDTRTESFSLSKTVTALMVGVALEDGLIDSVDAPVGRHLEAWRDDPRGAITLRQLLSMSSGLKPFSIADNDVQALRLLVGDVVEAAALASPLLNPLGAVFEYDNASVQVAGAVLRAVLPAGESYPAYLSRRLWRPLGCSDAALWAGAGDGAPRFSSGLHATLRDWLRIGRLILDRGEADGQVLVPAEWIAQMSAPSPANPRYGLGLWLGGAHAPKRVYTSVSSMVALHSEPFVPPDVVYLDGFGGQRVYVVPSRRLVVARTSEFRPDFDDAVLVNTLVRGMETEDGGG